MIKTMNQKSPMPISISSPWYQAASAWAVSWAACVNHLKVGQKDLLLRLMRHEIRWSSVEVGSLSHYLQDFSTISGGWPWDFWTINSITLGTPNRLDCCGRSPSGRLVHVGHWIERSTLWHKKTHKKLLQLSWHFCGYSILKAWAIEEQQHTYSLIAIGKEKIRKDLLSAYNILGRLRRSHKVEGRHSLKSRKWTSTKFLQSKKLMKLFPVVNLLLESTKTLSVFCTKESSCIAAEASCSSHWETNPTFISFNFLPQDDSWNHLHCTCQTLVWFGTPKKPWINGNSPRRNGSNVGRFPPASDPQRLGDAHRNPRCQSLAPRALWALKRSCHLSDEAMEAPMKPWKHSFCHELNVGKSKTVLIYQEYCSLVILGFYCYAKLLKNIVSDVFPIFLGPQRGGR